MCCFNGGPTDSACATYREPVSLCFTAMIIFFSVYLSIMSSELIMMAEDQQFHLFSDYLKHNATQSTSVRKSQPVHQPLFSDEPPIPLAQLNYQTAHCEHALDLLGLQQQHTFFKRERG